MVLPETSKNDRGTDVLSLNSPLIVPNIQKETVANTINKDTKRGKKVTLGVVKHWNRLSRETAYPCRCSQTASQTLEQHDLPSKMDITLKFFLLWVECWTKWSPEVLSRLIIWWSCDNEVYQYKKWPLLVSYKCPAGCYLSASEV